MPKTGKRRRIPAARAPKTGKRRRSPAPLGDLPLLVGARLREVRTAHGLSQSELGAPHFTRAHISAIELGKVLPSLGTLAFFARRLGLRLRELTPDV